MAKNATVILTITLILSVTFSRGIKLPRYIHRCSLSQSNLSQCFSDGANIAIPKLVKGNKDFGIPPLSHFKIADVYSPYGSQFKFQLINATAGKLEDVRYIFSSISRASKVDGNGTLHLPELRVQGHYEIDGKLKGVPLNGSGLAEITFTDVFCQLSWNLDRVQRDGLAYFKPVDLTVSYSMEGATYSFSNLNASGRFSGKVANGFLNRNWRALGKFVAPRVVQGIRNAALLIAERICDVIPIAELYDD